jgi:nucleoside-diphosphate-sugar epimerase
MSRNKFDYNEDLEGVRIDRNGTGHKPVMITGAAGFIGSNLVRTLLAAGKEVYAVDNLITGKMENLLPFFDNRKFHFLKVDINKPVLKDLFKNLKLGGIYHLACPTGVPNIKLMGEEMILTCSVGTTNVMEIARAHGAKVVIASSAEVYGQPLVSPQEESYTGNADPIGPRSAYEEGKRFSEAVLKMYADKYGLHAKIVRIFNTYGPGMSLSDQRIIPQLLQSVKENRNFIIYGDGSQTRTFLYVDDLVKGLMAVMQKGKAGEAYNVGGGEQITMRELAELVKKMTGSTNEIEYRPHFIEDHKMRQPSTLKAQALGWRQSVSLEDGLGAMISTLGIYERVPAKKKQVKE